MSTSNEQNRHMAMLQAALPYVTPQSRHAMEIVLQANSLLRAISKPCPSEDEYSLAAAETDETTNPDPEEMLRHIKEYCTPKEADTIQVILNFLHADKLFKNYRSFTNSHPDLQATSDISQNTQSPLTILFQLINDLGALSGNFNSNTLKNNNQMMEFLLSQLSPEQKSTFEQFQNIMYNQ